MRLATEILSHPMAQSGQAFRPNDVRPNKRTPSAEMAEACKHLVDQGRLVLEEGRYRIPSRARDWLTNRGNCWPVPSVARGTVSHPLEWCRA